MDEYQWTNINSLYVMNIAMNLVMNIKNEYDIMVEYDVINIVISHAVNYLIDSKVHCVIAQA